MISVAALALLMHHVEIVRFGVATVLRLERNRLIGEFCPYCVDTRGRIKDVSAFSVFRPFVVVELPQTLVRAACPGVGVPTAFDTDKSAHRLGVHPVALRRVVNHGIELAEIVPTVHDWRAARLVGLLAIVLRLAAPRDGRLSLRR